MRPAIPPPTIHALNRCAANVRVAAAGWIEYAPALMSALVHHSERSVARETVLELTSDMSLQARNRLALADLMDGLRMWRLSWILGKLDIQLRYRGSLLGPFWLTLSTGVMVASLGLLYSTLFQMDLHEYLPFLALSLVLWGYLGTLVSDGCVCFTQSEGIIRSVRMPYSLHAARVLVRNVLVLAHNIIVIAVVYLTMEVSPGWHIILVLPGLLLWAVDSLAISMLLGAFCARFRDIPPIVASVMQIAFFMTPIIWKPELVGDKARFLPLNPFFALMEVVRAPLLGSSPGMTVWVAALLYSAALCGITWAIFLRVRGRLAFWV